jgi:hypothetical protein
MTTPSRTRVMLIATLTLGVAGCERPRHTPSRLVAATTTMVTCSDRHPRCRARRGRVRRALPIVPWRRRARRSDWRQEGRTALGTRFVERWRRRSTGLHAGRDHSLHHAVPRSGESLGRRRPACRRVYQLAAAAGKPVQGSRLRRRQGAGRRRVLPGPSLTRRFRCIVPATDPQRARH